MKEGIHPEYSPVVFVDVSCGYKFLTRSTLSSGETIEWEDGNTYALVKVDISSASHPFYTGKRQQMSERGGRVEQFRKRYKLDEEKEGEGKGAVSEASAQA